MALVIPPPPDGQDPPEEDPLQTGTWRWLLTSEDILEHIFQHVDFQTLKTFRLVHTVWNLVATRLLTPKCCSLSYGAFNQDEEAMERLMKIIQTQPGFPCKRFTLMCGQNPEETIQKWTQVVAPKVKELEILWLESYPLNPSVPSFDLLRRLFLYFESSSDSDEDVLRGNVAIVKKILQQAPKLEAVHLNLGDSSPEAISSFLEMMRQIGNRKLKELNWCGDMTQEHIQKFLDSRWIKLKMLELFLTVLDETTLNRFIDSQRNTLETLQVEESNRLIADRLVLRVSKLLRLKLLEITGSANYSSQLCLSAISLRDQFPNLKTLILHISKLQKLLEMQLFRPTMQPTESVTVLKLLFVENPLMAQDREVILALMREMGRIFPKLKKLTITTNPLVVGALFQVKMSESLQELTLAMEEEGYKLEECLTGLSIRDLGDVRRLSSHLFELINKSMEPAPLLRQLKTLRFEAGWMDGFPDDILSDLSCHLVLLKLTNLTFLDLSRLVRVEDEENNVQQISPEVLAAMKKMYTVLL